MPHRVFTSYAVLDRSTQMEKFMKLFHEVLRTKVGAYEAEEIEKLVFFDFRGIRPGNVWTQALADEAGEAELLVCLVSPTYLNSPWCGQELEVFHQRHTQWESSNPGRAGQATFVFPVWWERDPFRPLPDKLSKFQAVTFDSPRGYKGGLRQLADLSKYRDAFKSFVEALVTNIRTALSSRSKLPTIKVDFATVANAFMDQPRPYDIHTWFAVPGGEAWLPSGVGRPICQEVAASAALMRVSLHGFNPSALLGSQISVLQNERQILLVIADANTPPGGALAQLHGLPQGAPLALLLVDGKTAPGQTPRSVADWLAGLPEGNFHAAAKLQHVSSTLPGNVTVEVEKIVTRVRLSLINGDAGATVQNEALANAAASRGITTATKASLTGSVTTSA
ncbi:toll/interleukin-1 receptor domain-containing protein [Verrucomicrobium sp. BvORR106]|uniref:toll/interleukin-1 receptor domain-containing protein n=1 Tax=Verrucomicrobium sp. BvORR106 TaxID=1403819 RepID=UPI0009DFB155|nr:toll/interleukin-1 receptor domain-containing protein [Verrucomicrobium sp. BvORR106]